MSPESGDMKLINPQDALNNAYPTASKGFDPWTSQISRSQVKVSVTSGQWFRSSAEAV